MSRSHRLSPISIEKVSGCVRWAAADGCCRPFLVAECSRVFSNQLVALMCSLGAPAGSCCLLVEQVLEPLTCSCHCCCPVGCCQSGSQCSVQGHRGSRSAARAAALRHSSTCQGGQLPLIIAVIWLVSRCFSSQQHKHQPKRQRSTPGAMLLPELLLLCMLCRLCMLCDCSSLCV